MSQTSNDEGSGKRPGKAGDNSFLAQAGNKRGNVVGDFVGFMRQNKKWWLAPIIIAVLGLGLLVILGGTAAAPFIYTLF